MKKKNRGSEKIVASERLSFALSSTAESQAKIFEIMGLVGMSRNTKIKMFIAKNQPFG